MARRIKRIFTVLIICLLGGMIMFGLFGCNDKEKSDDTITKYKVDYDGQKDWYGNAEDEYAAGEEVELYYGIYATDTDYFFYLDGEDLNYTFDDQKGIVIRFTMPEHDVMLTCESRNSMEYIPPTEPEGAEVMLIDSYSALTGTDGGDGYDEMALFTYSDDEVKLNVYHQEGDTDEVMTTYIVPYRAVDECYAVIDRCQMRDWNKLDDVIALDGAMLVCKFRDGDGYTRVTSDAMPENGEKAFSEIEAVLRGYVKDEYRVTE